MEYLKRNRVSLGIWKHTFLNDDKVLLLLLLLQVKNMFCNWLLEISTYSPNNSLSVPFLTVKNRVKNLISFLRYILPQPGFIFTSFLTNFQCDHCAASKLNYLTTILMNTKFELCQRLAETSDSDKSAFLQLHFQPNR